jgi:hypothetical protein
MYKCIQMDAALRSAIDLCFRLWINLGCTPRHDSS